MIEKQWTESIEEVHFAGDIGFPAFNFELNQGDTKVATLQIWPSKRWLVLRIEGNEYPLPFVSLEEALRVMVDVFRFPKPVRIEEIWKSIEDFPISFKGADDFNKAHKMLKKRWEKLLKPKEV